MGTIPQKTEDFEDSGGSEGGTRSDGNDPEELGLTLADGKSVLKQVQERIVQIQIEAISAAAMRVRIAVGARE